MKSVNMLEAKTHLSRLVDRIESGEDREIVVARNGRPVARLVPIANRPTGKRIGLLKGQFKAPSLQQLDARNADIERAFHDGG
ncbi:MAG: type II toxin-antitoxin system prevent-host-death family antitoxin [Xanthomonadales bacterium]|nr:type II toxin-antitoxin system prevent-host-death family antitoxin [Xanthomonadales bacterium]